MRLGLIAMSGVRVIDPELAWLGVTLPGFLDRGHVIAALPSLSLLTIAGLCGDDIDMEYIEIPHLLDFNAQRLPQFDVVAISSYSAQIDEAYRLGDYLRQRGTHVVLGGPHVSALPDEAQPHADTIILGEAETHWPTFLSDYRAGHPKSRYGTAGQTPTELYDLSQSPIPRFDLLDPENYNRIPIQTSRGCPHACEFCAGSRLFGPGYRQKPVANVVRELEALCKIWHRPFVEFADDNLFVNPTWSADFLDAITPMGIRWFAETDISIADQPELLARLRQSGCYQLLIGLESLSPNTLSQVESTGFKAAHAADYAQAVQRIQSHGVTVNTCFVVGMDGDTPDVFDTIRQFERNAKPCEIQVTLLTPFPGTPLYDRLAAEGRLLPDPTWEKRTLFDVTYQPVGMTADQLQSGIRELFTDLYNDEASARRHRHFRHLMRQWRDTHKEN